MEPQLSKMTGTGTEKKTKTKRRGFVMTGGGAKGLYEAGVINAFHLTGMEFDVITGSSIGAMNSIFFAEYLLRKRKLSPKLPATADQALEILDKMDGLIRCYHHTWLQMPTEQVIDDSNEGAISKMVKQLGDFKINLSDLITLGWWFTDPRLENRPPAETLVSSVGTLQRAIKALGRGSFSDGLAELLRIYKNKDLKSNKERIRQVSRIYLRNLDLEHSVIPAAKNGSPGEDAKIENMFTRKVAPLANRQLARAIEAHKPDPAEGDVLIDPNRTLRDYKEKKIDVRLTRANYRTGRLEIAAYLSTEDFRKYMQKHAWRMENTDLEKMPLGSFRLQLPGNPKAIKAALASGRFPGVFAPFPLIDIYPKDDPENTLLYQLVEEENGKATPIAETQKTEEKDGKVDYFADDIPLQEWPKMLKEWQVLKSTREFFPFSEDTYVDGGAIDNTPTNSAVDATREWIEANRKSRRDVILELYIIFLEKEPSLPREKAEDPLLYEVVQRTLTIQSAAVKTSDAAVVDTINTYGKRGDELARTLLAVIKAFEESGITWDQGQLDILERCILDEAPRSFAYAYQKAKENSTTKKGTLQFMKDWAQEMLDSKLPLHVDEVKIYPDNMSLSTLQFTERLGYKQENAIDMITMGCYNTLETMRDRLVAMEAEDRNTKKPPQMDEQDRISLALVRKWMVDEKGSKRGWACMRTECVFHEKHCPHGLNPKA